MQQTSESLNLEWALRVLRHNSLGILLCAALAGGMAFAYSKQQPKRYTATASLVFSSNQLSQQVAGLQIVGNSEAQQAVQNTNVKLVQLGDMAAKTAGLLGRHLTEQAVRESLTIDAPGESNIVAVTASARSPELAADIANTYTREFVEEQQRQNHAYYSSALVLVSRQLASMSPRQRLSPAGLALENRAQSLGVLAELRSGNVQVAQGAAPPTQPSSPKPVRNTILGAALGLLLGAGLAFLLERLDRRIREPKDLESVYGLPLLGVVPESKALARVPRSAEAGASADLPSAEAEAFHLIRAHLRYFNVDRQLHTILVASAAPGDGKTTVARHLATAAARMGSRVLLMEVDLRRPTLAQQLSIPRGPGLSDVLIGAISLSDAIQSLELQTSSHTGHTGRTLDVLTSGAAPPPNPAELLESHAMEGVLSSVKSLYDLVIVDTPPLTAVSDAFPLLSRMDGVIVVGRVGRSRRDVAQRLHETLAGAGAPLLGVIANGVKSGSGAYGYSYGYGSHKGARGPAQPASEATRPSRRPISGIRG